MKRAPIVEQPVFRQRHQALNPHEVGGLHEQRLGFPVCLQVDPRSEMLVHHERQHVIAMNSLVGRHIDLDAVLEPKSRSARLRSQTRGRMERKQCLRFHAARDLEIWQAVGRTAPALHRDRH